MKTRLFLLAAAATIGLTACQNENAGTGYTQEQLDSIVQFKADSASNALKMENDSMINAMAIDSANRAAQNTKATTTTTTKTTTNKKPSTSTPVPTTPSTVNKAPETRTPAQIEADKKAARFGDAEAEARLKTDEANKKAARFGDPDAKQKVQETEAQKKADRFNK